MSDNNNVAVLDEETMKAVQEAAKEIGEKGAEPGAVIGAEEFLESLEEQEVPKAADLDEGIDKAVEQFDVTRRAREEAMARVKQTLDRAAKGAKIDRGDVAKALSGLYLTTQMQDELLVTLIGDIMRTIKALAVSEGNIMQQGIQITTLARTLQKKDIVQEEEMQKVYTEEIMPQLKQQMPQSPVNEAAGQDLSEKFTVPTDTDSTEK